MKKTIAVLITVLLCLGAVVSVSATSTDIITEVPTWLSIDLTVSGGKVQVNGTDYGNGTVVMIPY
ncbi:MAG: hypothetical protein FWD71_21365, partial [Oscillospiraceae bacterium]|nr:hypothetical protein [Oscillospiraceae bacterium]